MKVQEQKNIKIKQPNQNIVSVLIFSGFNALLSKVIDMNQRGVSEEIQQGELRGQIKNGKEIRMKYGCGIKIGLDDFVKKMKSKN